MNIKHITERMGGTHLWLCSSHQGKSCDCGATAARDKLIDASIKAAEEALSRKADRRGPVQLHEPEQRDGFDRRSRVVPAKE
jgi:hypothetical protein